MCRCPFAANSKGNSLFGLGRYDEAIKYYDTAIAAIPKDPDLAIALSNKGSCLYYLGRYDEAIQYFDEALHYFPKDRSILDERLNALNSKNK